MEVVHRTQSWGWNSRKLGRAYRTLLVIEVDSPEGERRGTWLREEHKDLLRG